MNKKNKKTAASSLPDFNKWQEEYYKKNPQQIGLLARELIEEFNSSPDMPVEVLLTSLRRIAQLQGMGRLAQKTKLNREHLYKSLSAKGNPTVRTLDKVAACMGYRLTLTPLHSARQ